MKPLHDHIYKVKSFEKSYQVTSYKKKLIKKVRYECTVENCHDWLVRLIYDEYMDIPKYWIWDLYGEDRQNFSDEL